MLRKKRGVATHFEGVETHFGHVETYFAGCAPQVVINKLGASFLVLWVVVHGRSYLVK